MTHWLILTATLPTTPSGLRVRVWRALKTTGAGTLREGVYVLPAFASSAAALRELAKTIADAGADAHLLELRASDDVQEQAFRALFDRSEFYAELVQAVKDARKGIRSASEAALHKTLRNLEQQLQQVQASDFFPGKASAGCVEAVSALRREIELHLSPDEPSPTKAVVPTLSIGDYQGRIWATRKRPWVDRLATAWLVSRFVDKSPNFIWLSDPKKCPKQALGYDFDGAAFTHVGELVTFEVVAKSFGLDKNPSLARLGQLVHYIDAGGIPLDEAPGIEMIVRGLQAQHGDDDQLLEAAFVIFDTLHAALKASQ
ncbi:MAG: chromate resistance protein ChrB domain-containing protein [Pseudomonadota bacterium]